MKANLAAIVFAAALALQARGAETRYFSADGDDAADGRTPQTAWASLVKLSALPSGGTALFRRGDVFYGMLHIPAGTGDGAPTTVGAYGEGARPVVTAMKTVRPEAWRESSVPGVWQVDLGDPANFTGNMMSLDGNVGYLKTDGTIRYAKKFEPAGLAGEWDFCDDRRVLSVKASAPPWELAGRIEVATDDHLLPLKDHIAVRDIEFRGTGSHGANGSARDVVIDNCVFREIGGSRLYGFMDDAFRYGNGIEFWTDSRDALVSRCRFSDIYDTAFTMQGTSPSSSWANIHVVDCTFERTTQAFEIWTTGCPEGVGFENCSFERNLCLDIGRGWGYDARPNKEVATPLLAYMLETDVCDILIASNRFVNSRGELLYKLGGIETLPPGYRLDGNTTGGGIVLESKSLSATFDENSGSLVALRSRVTGWEISRREELGRSWKLLIPLGEDLRDNLAWGDRQAKPACEKGDGFVRFVWNGVVSERGGAHDIRVVQEIRLEDGELVWHTRIDNNSPYVVESVFSPEIGDLSRPSDADSLKVMAPSYCQAYVFDLWPNFTPSQGDYGSDSPINTRWGPTAAEPFDLVFARNEGLYIGVRERSDELVTWFYELLPGFSEAMSGKVPDGDEIGGKKVHTVLSAVHQPYIQGGESRELTPIVLDAYAGGWEEGCDIYKRWVRQRSKSAIAPDWAREPHSWLQVHINSPEDELRTRFPEIPAIAEECAANGVKAIQLVGWNDGGQDQGNPSHDHDPRLGTRDELKAAVEECEKLGVKLIIFSKFTWADRATDWYRNELEAYAVTDPYGDARWCGGYAYFTPAQYLGLNVKRFAPMCFASDRYLEICQREFEKVAGLGARDFLYDECQHHGGALLCFNTAHGHRYGWPTSAKDNALVEMFRETPGLGDDFLFAGEACNDWEYEVYHLAYFRSRNRDHVPMQRYIRPEVELMTAVSGFDDRDMIDQCLLCRYIISYEPYNFHGRLRDFPLTLEYGQKMDALRTELRKWLWDGEFRGRQGASVTRTDGTPHAHFSRFEAADGTSMLAVANYSDEPVEVSAKIGGAAVAEFSAVEDAGFSAAGRTIAIAPHSAVVAR